MDNYEQKISHLKALYHLACADNVLTKVEAVYIKNVAERLGIKSEELLNFEQNEPKLELPDREYKIYALFHRLAIIIMIDNTMSDRERHYCFNLGIRMGLHPNAIGEIIDHIETRGSMDVMPAEIMNIFRKYLS
ncbi:MAG TPA: TerB family tellurite resistance protein [Ohtaekwangia sp.]